VVIAHDVKITAHDAALKGVTGFTVVRPVTIGDGAYVGAGSILLPGASVGERSIIGAGSVVTGAIPPDTVAFGNPCRVHTSTQELRERHVEEMASAPSFDKRARDVPMAERMEMRAALERHGVIYVR
jgi:maltose O-acetyltransferase